MAVLCTSLWPWALKLVQLQVSLWDGNERALCVPQLLHLSNHIKAVPRKRKKRTLVGLTSGQF